MKKNSDKEEEMEDKQKEEEGEEKAQCLSMST